MMKKVFCALIVIALVVVSRGWTKPYAEVKDPFIRSEIVKYATAHMSLVVENPSIPMYDKEMKIYDQVIIAINHLHIR